MNLYSLKKIWKNKRRNRLLLFEFFLSFLMLFSLLSIVGKFLYNKKTPLGFEYQNVWNGILYPEIPLTDSAQLTIKKEIFQSITARPEVLAITQQINNMPFVRNQSYTGYFKYNDIVLGKNYAFGVDDNFAEVMGLEIVEGRWFRPSDEGLKTRPIVISKSMRQKLGDENIIGSEVLFHYKKEPCRIVGVIEDYKYGGEYSSLQNQVFFRCSLDANPNYSHVDDFGGYDINSQSNYNERIYFKVKPGSGLKLEALLQKELIERFPDWTFRFEPLTKQKQIYMNVFWLPIAIFAGISLFLIFNVVIGLFAVLWYNINHRKQEIGLRIANGATKTHIYNQFIVELLWISIIGILPGIVIALQFPVMGVFQVEFWIYIQAMVLSAIVIFFLVTLSAILPCRQAAKIQPAIALHEE